MIRQGRGGEGRGGGGVGGEVVVVVGFASYLKAHVEEAKTTKKNPHKQDGFNKHGLSKHAFIQCSLVAKKKKKGF